MMYSMGRAGASYRQTRRPPMVTNVLGAPSSGALNIPRSLRHSETAKDAPSPPPTIDNLNRGCKTHEILPRAPDGLELGLNTGVYFIYFFTFNKYPYKSSKLHWSEENRV